MNKTKIKDSFEKLEMAFRSLEEALDLPIETQRDLAGIIQNFEFVYELTWKTMKRLLEAQGQTSTTPRDTLKKAYKVGLIQDENTWLQIIEDRNLSSHTYNQKLAKEISDRVQSQYRKEFQRIVRIIRKELETLN